MWVYMDNLGPAFLGFYHVGIGDGMGLGHVTAHDQNSIAIDEVLWKGCGTATPQRCTQTGYGGAVSNAGMVLNREHA